MLEDPAHCGRDHHWDGGPGTTSKQHEQVMRKKPVMSTPPWTLYHLFPPGSNPLLVPAYNPSTLNVEAGTSIEGYSVIFNNF